MRYVGWVVKAVLFLLLLGFAVKNTEMTVVRYYLGIEWHAPLVFVLLVTFAAGVLLGVVATASRVFRERRDGEVARRAESAPPQGFEEGA
ncbi:MAG: LapA family protein [Burkholderiales bacterium]|nr:LapA family protein [Burkholderiales bacterium]